MSNIKSTFMKKIKTKNLLPLVSIGLLALSAIFYSCQKESVAAGDNLNGPHPIQIFLTDHVTPVFDSLFIDIQRLELKLEDDSLPNDGWVNIPVRAGVYNILRLRNGLDTLFGNTTLPSGRIKKIRLTLGAQNSAMKNNQSFPLKLHNEDRQVVIDIDESHIELNSSGQISTWIDFDAGRSVEVDNSGSGNNNGYRLKPHISAFSRHHSASLEGKVLPIASDAIVMAINGTDTTMAVPDDDDGEFKIMGLHAGVYKIIYDGQNGYRDSTLTNITVAGTEDKHLPTITLHQ